MEQAASAADRVYKAGGDDVGADMSLYSAAKNSVSMAKGFSLLFALGTGIGGTYNVLTRLGDRQFLNSLLRFRFEPQTETTLILLLMSAAGVLMFAVMAWGERNFFGSFAPGESPCED